MKKNKFKFLGILLILILALVACDNEYQNNWASKIFVAVDERENELLGEDRIQVDLIYFKEDYINFFHQIMIDKDQLVENYEILDSIPAASTWEAYYEPEYLINEKEIIAEGLPMAIIILDPDQIEYNGRIYQLIGRN